MYRQLLVGIALSSSILFAGCASVPMAPVEADTAAKQFSAPPDNMANLYIFRNSAMGQSLKKPVFIDGKMIGETANKVYFYRQIPTGEHTLSTLSEFGENSLVLNAANGKNYFVEQEIKLGVFVGGSNLRILDEEKGKAQIQRCKLAK